MKISIKNLGAIKQAEFTLGELTIICGGNNTGKTYATYALFGFLSFWRGAFSIKVPDDDVLQLMNEGAIEINIQDYIHDAPSILEKGCKSYTEKLPQVFASSEKNFSDCQFFVDLDFHKAALARCFSRATAEARGTNHRLQAQCLPAD